MPPKTWNKPAHQRSAAHADPVSAAHNTVNTKEAAARVKTHVVRAINDNNLLGLPDSEISSMADILVKAETTAEVFEWTKTLMLGESLAADVIKMREDLGLRFGKGGSAPAAAAPATSSPTPSGGSKSLSTSKSNSSGSSAKAKKKGNRGQPLTTIAKDDLVPGVFFECGCYATKHAFKASCLNCGRIICAQEDTAFCYYCGLDPNVCVSYELKKASGLIDEAAQQKNTENYQKAVDRRDNLLQFAKERAKRTVVIDDQSGVHSNSAWLTKEERDEAAEAEKKRVSELHKKTGAYTVHLDIVNQNAVLGASAVPQGTSTLATPAEQPALEEEAPPAASPEAAESDDDDGSGNDAEGARVQPLPAVMQKIWYNPDGSQPAPTQEDGNKARVVRTVKESKRVQNDYFEEDNVAWNEQHQGANAAADGKVGESLMTFRVDKVPDMVQGGDATKEGNAGVFDSIREHVEQTEGIPQQMPQGGLTAKLRKTDDGMCLSMHQPWASLLVAGIKRHEGRSWPTELRGRLWIHAAAAKPSGVAELEDYYRKFPWNADKCFPSQYPTSCLLGYVYVTDCLDSKEYAERFSEVEREESSEYKFICEEPKPLLFPLQMDGQHKIYKLERKMWMAAKKQVGEKR